MRATKTLAAIDDALVAAQDSGHRWHLGASLIGRECLREVFYVHRFAKDRTIPARILRLFDRGHKEEARFVGWLRAAGVEVSEYADEERKTQHRVLDATGHFGGSLDAILRNVPDLLRGQLCVGEFKTHNAKSFANVCALGVEKAKPEHFTQMAVYMAAKSIPFALYVAGCKDDDDLYLEIIEWGQATQDAVTRANERAAMVLSSDQPPPRMSDSPAFWKCRMCDFKGICHGAEVPAINCRTCAHAAIGPNGTWTCARFNWTFTKDTEDSELDAVEREHANHPPRMRDGCAHHVFNPYLLNGVEYLGGDEKENYTELKLPNGTVIYNGPSRTPSDRLCLSDPAPISKKPSTPRSRSSTATKKAPR